MNQTKPHGFSFIQQNKTKQTKNNKSGTLTFTKVVGLFMHDENKGKKVLSRRLRRGFFLIHSSVDSNLHYFLFKPKDSTIEVCGLTNL